MNKIAEFSLEIENRHRRVLYHKVVPELLQLVNDPGWVCPVQRRYLRFVYDLVVSYDVLVAHAQHLCEFVRFAERYFFQWRDPLPGMLTKVNEKLMEVFPYSDFSRWKGRGANGWGGFPLMNELKHRLKCCPYCNSDLVYAIDVEDGGNHEIKSAFDHYFPRGRYPFLSVSLYNLIPACFRCNSQLKRDHFAELLKIPHPYRENLADLSRFVPCVTSSACFYSDSHDDELSLYLRAKRRSDDLRVADYAHLFKLNEVYSQLHSNEAGDAIRKSVAYSSEYIATMRKCFATSGIMNVDIERVLFGVKLDEDRIDANRLSKMIGDIRNQFAQT